MKTYLTGFAWNISDASNKPIILFSIYLNGEKIIDKHTIDLNGEEPVNYEN